MRGNFRFNLVGQGLFYSGFIDGNNGKRFSVVYDCGSDSKISYRNKEIDDFKHYLKADSSNSEINTSVIDLLVISHFDRDHINGLE